MVSFFHLFQGVNADSVNRSKREDLQNPEVTPLFISKNYKREKIVNLLLVSNSKTSHYIAIKGGWVGASIGYIFIYLF